MNIFCIYCGAENAPHARFCRSCRKLIALPGTYTTVRPFSARPEDEKRPQPAPPTAGPLSARLPAMLTGQVPPLHVPTGTTARNGWTVPAQAAPYPTAPTPPSSLTYPPAPDPQAGTQPLRYQVDPATGLPFDPYFRQDPLPVVPPAGTPAAFFPRLGALLVDSCILSVLWFAAVGLAAFVDSPLLGVLSTLLGPALYFIAFWAMGGRTPGYRAAGLRLIHTDGSSVGVGASIVRYAGSLVSWPLLCLGYLWMLWDPRGQTWHDKMADTTVIQS